MVVAHAERRCSEQPKGAHYGPIASVADTALANTTARARHKVAAGTICFFLLSGTLLFMGGVFFAQVYNGSILLEGYTTFFGCLINTFNLLYDPFPSDAFPSASRWPFYVWYERVRVSAAHAARCRPTAALTRARARGRQVLLLHDFCVDDWPQPCCCHPRVCV